VFGPQRKHRVWLVLDGDMLYVDKNGNGDLTEEGKRIKVPAFSLRDYPVWVWERRSKSAMYPSEALPTLAWW